MCLLDILKSLHANFHQQQSVGSDPRGNLQHPENAIHGSGNTKEGWQDGFAQNPKPMIKFGTRSIEATDSGSNPGGN